MNKIKNPWLHKTGYNCICCSPTNPIGLHLEFWEDGDDVLTHWTPTPERETDCINYQEVRVTATSQSRRAPHRHHGRAHRHHAYPEVIAALLCGR